MDEHWIKKSWKRHLLSAGLPLVLLATALACTLTDSSQGSAPPEPAPATEVVLPPATPDLAAELPFEGVWRSDAGVVLVFTPTTYYLHELLNETSREEFGAVQEFDLENQHILILLSEIRVMGQDAGFDFPQRFLTYRVEDNRLLLTTDSSNYPAEAGDQIFTRQ